MQREGFHLTYAPPITTAGEGGPTVMTDTVAVLGSDMTEEPEPLELVDRVTDRIGTDPLGGGKTRLTTEWRFTIDSGPLESVL